MYAIKNLRRRSARTSLLVIGVALAITLSTIMFSISEGINSSTKDLIDETVIDLFVYPGASNPILQEFTKYLDLNDGRKLANAMVEGNPKIRAASPVLVEGLYITSGKIDNPVENGGDDETDPKIFSIQGRGYVPELHGDFGAIDQIAGGELTTKSDPFYANGTYDGGIASDNFTHEIVLNKQLAEFLEVGVGDIVFANSLGLPSISDNNSYEQWLEDAAWFTVNGIIVERYEPRYILSVTMHLSELQYLTGKHRLSFFGTNLYDFVNEIYIDLFDPDDKNEVKRWLVEEFDEKDRISVLTADELAGEFNSFLDIFKGFSTMIIIITSLVVILFISTIMMISVHEQGREIGMLRAIGISKKTIFQYILTESILICAIGFVIGVILGYAGSGILEDIILSTEEQIPVGVELTSITPELILQVSLITISIGVVAGIVPAIWAARLTPVESIRKVT